MWWTLPALLIGLSALSADASASAAAPCLLCAPGGNLADPTAPALPVRLEVETSLDFDRLILTGPSGGVARLGPDGSRITEGEVDAISPRAMIGELMIRGEAGRFVRVSMPHRIELVGSGGGTLSIRRLGSDLPATPRLDDNGRLRVRFGGELVVSGEAEGDYRGDVAITVDYL